MAALHDKERHAVLRYVLDLQAQHESRRAAPSHRDRGLRAVIMAWPCHTPEDSAISRFRRPGHLIGVYLRWTGASSP